MPMSAPGDGEAAPCRAGERSHALGLAAYRAGRLEAAVTHLRAAAVGNPSNVDYVCALGAALLAAGADAPAARCYVHILSHHPALAEAHLGLARARESQGDTDAAIAAVWRCLRLRPAFAEARMVLARLLRGGGHELAARREARRAQAGAPGGTLESGAANISECRRNEAQASRQLGRALAAAGQCEDAEGEILRAVILDPDDSQDMLALASLYERQERLAAAAGALRTALETDGSNAAALTALGGILARMGELDAAESSLGRALDLASGSVEARLNLANIDMERGRRDHALEHLERALELRPDYVQAHNNRANILLLQGRYGEGWDEYEWRRRMPRGAPPRLDIPDWQGRALDGKRLYVIGEQAAGDAIMFATCLAELAAVGGPVSLHCEARINGLMRRAFPWLEVSDRLPDDRDSGVRAGVTIALGSLPRLFRRDEADFARSRPYLVAPPSRVAQWRARYATLGEGLKIGFSWNGGKSHIQRRQRAMRLLDWAPLLGRRGAHFIDLQYGAEDAARAALRRRFGLAPYRPAEIDPGGDMDAFAAQVKALDLVISIDNTSVHFAGALGVPVWTLVPPSPSWRWQTERRDSPWYPGMTLFRRAAPESWGAVLERVAAALAAVIAGDVRDGEISADRQYLPGRGPVGRANIAAFGRAAPRPEGGERPLTGGLAGAGRFGTRLAP